MTDSLDLTEEGRKRAIEEYRLRLAPYVSPDLSWIPQFKIAVHNAIAATRILERLKLTGAVILERMACGAGATNWYYCADASKLEAVIELLQPGSLVSFYFDDRIKRAPYVAVEMKAIAANTHYPEHNLNVGTLKEDGVTINMVVSVDPCEFVEYDEQWSSAPYVFYGDFPGRDNDGINAVTLTTPDIDGVVRRHPY